MPELEDDPSQVHSTTNRLSLIFDWFAWRNQHPEIFLARTGEDGEPASWKSVISDKGADSVNTALFNLKRVAQKGAKLYLSDVLSEIDRISVDSSYNSHQGDPRGVQHWMLDVACWQNYCVALIYAAAGSPVNYVGEVERRRVLDDKARTASLNNGHHLHNWISESFQGTGLQKAMSACGDNLSDGRESKLRLRATMICCREWLPPRPAKKPV